MQGAIDSGEGDGSGVLIVSNIFEYGLKSVGLLDLLGKNIDMIALSESFVQVIGKQIKILVESRLGKGIKVDGVVLIKGRFVPDFNGSTLFDGFGQ